MFKRRFLKSCRNRERAEQVGQLDPQSAAAQTIRVLIGSPSFIAGKLPLAFASQSDMSLCNLFPLWMIACIAAGSGIARFVGGSIITGATFGALAGFAPMIALGVLYVAIMWWRPDLPPCRCGKTKYGEFEFIGPMSGPFSENTWYEICCPKCGRLYKSKGGIVVECRPDGSTIPYMKVSRWGRWVNDGQNTLT